MVRNKLQKRWSSTPSENAIIDVAPSETMVFRLESIHAVPRVAVSVGSFSSVLLLYIGTVIRTHVLSRFNFD